MFAKNILLVLSLCISAWSSSRAEDIGEGTGFTGGADTSLFDTREILLSLYDSTKGLRWSSSSGWLQTTDICQWHGVTCYSNQTTKDSRRVGLVHTLDLSNNHLVGSIPAKLWSLPYIQAIKLRDNPDLIVDFSTIEAAPYLQVVNVANTLVSSLVGVGRLSNSLQSLQVASLGLDGTLPDEIFNLTRLRGLYANYNRFNSMLPTQIGALSLLTGLYFYSNDFTGPLPTEIGLLTALKILTLAQNAFSGTLPSQLNKLTNLEILALHRNDGEEKGLGIMGNLLSFSELTSISQLYLENQLLKGPIPHDFLAGADPNAVISVNLMNNQLTGSVPNELTQLSRLQILLAGNRITRVSNQTCANIDGWMGGEVEDLHSCNAFLCPPKTYAPLGRATVTDSCLECTANALFYGATTCSSAFSPTGESVSERQILIEMYNRMGGRNWLNSDNWLDLSKDVCHWHGITCLHQNVTGIELKDNNLINSPPPELFQLSALETLKFSGNSIGFSFSGISQLNNLKLLDLSQTDLASLADITELAATKIRQLMLPANRLKGTVPPALFDLSTLVELDFSDNSFTGLLPSEVKQLTSLSSLRCFGNRLSGQFPSDIGTLTSLTELSCSENKFGGVLPTALNQLTKLQTLSLRQSTTQEAIGGPLLSFENLAQLTDLHLDSNKLTGALPLNFLQNSLRLGERIEVVLSDNMLNGSIPSAWTRFERLFIDLSGNQIIGIDNSLCQQANWMDGQVNMFQCAAILCPVNTFNEMGRQTNALCSNCSAPNPSLFFGSKDCGDANTTSNEYSLLETFYYSVSGHLWNNNTGWLVDNKYCQKWFGITCNAAGQVIKISLAGNALVGTVDSSLFLLPFLSELYLGNNFIGFPFNQMSEASNLKVLNLENIGLNSIDGIGQATSIVGLNLTSNDLTAFDSDLFRLPNLRTLSLDYNQLTGRIPEGIASMTKLEQLYLDRNRLTGQLPAAMGALTSLKILSLAGNDFEGTLPPELNNVVALEIFSVQRHVEANFSLQTAINDRESNPFPGIQGPLLSFNNLKHLKGLFLAGNSLSGSIPTDFLAGLDNKTEEIEVDLTSNQLSGQIPASLTQLEMLNIYLADNQITGIPATVCSAANWLHDEVGSIGCDAILCPINSYSASGRADMVINATCKTCPSGTFARFYGSPRCTNSSEQQMAVDRTVLTQFYQATGGSNWENNENWLNPDKSICSWYGVYCTDPAQEIVSGIVLERNGLVGNIPISLFKLSNLKELDLAGNDIKLDLQIISNAPSLESLNLDSTGLSSLAGIEKSEIVTLRVGGNDFGGTFPFELFNLSRLEVLHMSGAKIGNTLPSQIGSLTTLSFFECGSCGITGKLPAWIGSLFKLQHLSIFLNSITGELPAEISNLTKLKHLDLSFQGLEGALPDFAVMPDLTNIILSENQFNGSFPSNFLNASSNTSAPVTILLDSNQLSGSIPADLGRFSNMRLDLSNNRISFIPPTLCNSTWNEGDVQRHGCDGLLCGNGSFSVYGRAMGTVSCSPCPNATWLGTSVCGGDSQSELEILVTFFKDTNGFGWFDSDGWLEETDFCLWAGISCRPDGKIQSIKLDNNNIVGNVAGSLWQLQYLEELDLHGNNVVISFEGIENVHMLRLLQLSETKVSSLNGIGHAASLEKLFLDGTAIQGSIPGELFDVTTLQKLSLDNNELSGSLPTTIGNLTSLLGLSIFHNKLSGEIPTELASLKSVRVLTLGENFFNGTIPGQLNSMPNLEVLSLEGRPEQHVDVRNPFAIISFNDVPNLREIHLGFTNIAGTIPSDFLLRTNTSTAIVVDLTSNLLTGAIPLELARFQNLSLYLGGNQIRDIPPSLCNKTSWFDGDLSMGCDAFLCPPGTYNDFGRQVGSLLPCQDCLLGTAIWYGSMECYSHKKEKDKEILERFYNDTGGPYWYANDGWLDSNKDFCDWYGISCDIDGTVMAIILGGNNLVGTLQSEIFQLPSLRYLWLYSNPIDFSFQGIEHAVELSSLRLDATGLSSLDGIGNATSLSDIDVRHNKLNGELPTELSKLSNLQTFSCSFNELSGSIPDFSSNTQLETIRIAHNRFTGSLPSFSHHRSLKSIDISGNKLAGEIPSDFLASVENYHRIFVQLSSNQLSGTIPSTLSRFDDLSIFLKDNLIEGIGADLCSKKGWNDGDVSGSNCFGLLCPPQTFSTAYGRASSIHGTKCIPCDSATHYGASTCGLTSGVRRGQHSKLTIMSSLLFCLFTLV